MALPDFKWKTPFAEATFKNKYAFGPEDTWPNLCRRVVNDVCGDRSLCAKPVERPIMSQGDQAQLAEYMIKQMLIPGGRYLYYGGREVSFFNNCLSKDTIFMTSKGLATFADFSAGDSVEVLTRTGDYKPATITSFGEQELYTYEFSLVRGHQHTIKTVKATENHRWYLTDGTVTDGLKVGDVVAATIPQYLYQKDAFIHGLVFADGNVHHKKTGFGHQLRLCGSKNKYADLFENVTYPDFAGGDACTYITSPCNLKELPISDSPQYIASFIKGWLAGDGHKEKVLHSISEEAIDFFIRHAGYAGYVCTGDKKCDTKSSNFGERKPLYYVRFQRAETFVGFKVKAKNYYGKETVWCVVEPETTSFTLQGGMTTGNCFCLRAEEDTREEWGTILKKASDCLMSGGGIGVDYSRLRPSGRTLRRTGGISSGPVPLMSSVNEVGRNVMQGGSRRSAIWAGLNWKHDDIEAFLTAKNWSEEVKALKAKDFNFPATLDMTNISICYDTDFLERVCRGEVPELWHRSVLQMCKTGEPGHSYNFFRNENDTLRNACTEFTSEDDSDVCNLGSVNMGGIDTIEQFEEVVTLAAKFLICGSMRGDLPYDKVRDVREKNRKIGLGLMGIHEWLLKRGYGYEMNDELRSWLEIYKSASEKAANEQCDRFFLNHPKKYRAIAPAGTIGILASTTTGIEPLFAVAYKRRYLTGGTKWKYQYVIDATAQRLIEEYGLKPEDIETSSSLAPTPRKRIQFQWEVQRYVDMSISSTINLPEWGSEYNNEDTAKELSEILLNYCAGLRGITVYPSGSRGGQPLTEVPYEEAKRHVGMVFDEVEEGRCVGGVCGI